MPDREKTLDDLKLLNRLCHGTVLDDAIALLKEQEAAYQGAVELLRQKTILFDDAIKRLKEQEAVVKQWIKEIADNQLAHAPDELDRENWDYKKGIWDGLQIAWNIISEGR